MDRYGAPTKRYQINEASQRVGLSHKRIRDYEKAGFIKPLRELRTNNRIYDESDIKRLIRIKELIHEYGFTVTCLRYFLAAAPCWTIFNCKNRASCQAYQNPHTPCYEKTQVSNGTSTRKCDSCPVYMNRNADRITLLEDRITLLEES